MSSENNKLSVDATSSPLAKRAAVKPLNVDALAHEPNSVKQQRQPNNTTDMVGYPVPAMNMPQGNFAPWPPSQTAMTEQEFYHTRSLLPHVQRPALAAVLQSLMDDYPHLAPLIRVRCEKAMAVVMNSGAQQVNPHGGTPPNISPSHPYVAGHSASQEHTPLAAGGSNRKNSRRGGAKEEETETCGAHGTTRSMKHLQFNQGTKHWECVPGFHCLENGTSTTPSPSVSSLPTVSPVKAPQANSQQPPLVRTNEPEDDPIDVKRLETLLQDLRQQS